MSRTQAEFNPDFFRSLFGESREDWRGFLGVSIRAIEETRDKLAAAVAAQDLKAISETRHSIGPSLTQWGVVTLEGDLRQLDADQMRQWPDLEAEFNVLLTALRRLETEP